METKKFKFDELYQFFVFNFFVFQKESTKKQPKQKQKFHDKNTWLLVKQNNKNPEKGENQKTEKQILFCHFPPAIYTHTHPPDALSNNCCFYPNVIDFGFDDDDHYFSFCFVKRLFFVTWIMTSFVRLASWSIGQSIGQLLPDSLSLSLSLCLC